MELEDFNRKIEYSIEKLEGFRLYTFESNSGYNYSCPTIRICVNKRCRELYEEIMCEFIEERYGAWLGFANKENLPRRQTSILLFAEYMRSSGKYKEL